MTQYEDAFDRYIDEVADYTDDELRDEMDRLEQIDLPRDDQRALRDALAEESMQRFDQRMRG